MPVPTIPDVTRLTKVHTFSAAGLAAVGAATLVFAAVPQPAESQESPQAGAVRPTAWHVEAFGGQTQQKILEQQSAEAAKEAEARRKAAAEEMARAKTAYAADQKKKAQAAAQAEQKKKAEAEARAKAERERAAKEAASRNAARKPVYADNLDGWIKESLAIMKEKGIPGTYQGIHRNIIRESGGNPRAINNWDINAKNGVPSKGLLQVIKPTFDAYHVEGTAWDQYDPVANITAACNYAADRYGSIDNVYSAY